MSPAVPGLSPALSGAPRLVAVAPSYSEGRQECPPRVWYSPEIDASKFTLHILSDTPGGFQWLKYILLMLCNATRRLGDWRHVILGRRVRGSVRAIRAIQIPRVFLTETRVVADVLSIFICHHSFSSTSLLSWKNIMLCFRSLYLHSMLMSYPRVQHIPIIAYIEYSIIARLAVYPSFSQ